MPLRSLYDLPAPAKLNLFLHIVGRRADGYHLLESPFQLIDWADTLHIDRREDGQLHRHDLGPALPADDLCLRAARLLQTESGTALGADIHIDKHLPWGAGLGGGSSDAATVLLALNRLWGLNWPRQRLCALGARLGADVPFFVGGHNAFVQGIGEILTPLPADVLPAQAFAVVKPEASLPTAAIFSSEKLTRDTKSVIVMGSRAGNAAQAADANGSEVISSERGLTYQVLAETAEHLGEWHSGFGRNDLQPAAEAVCTEVTQVARWLEQRFGNSRMTGSGSAVFARVGTETCPGDQPPATQPLAAMPAAWTGRMCRGLLHHPLVGWAAD